MKKTAIMILVAISVFSVSCKKNSEVPVPTTKADYYKLKVGNYWIYQAYNIDTNGVATPTASYDSAHIEKDTIIRGYTYYKLLENVLFLFPNQYPTYLRDSSGYLVNSFGYIRASDVNFTDTLAVLTNEPQVYTGYLKMTGLDSLVTTAAGTFHSITSRYQIVPTPPNVAKVPVRYHYEVFGRGVGKMKAHSFFFFGGQAMEGRLVRYKVN